MSGVHIQVHAMHHKEDSSVMAMKMTIWPLPAEVVPGLAEFLRDRANEYLVEKQIVSGEVTELPLSETKQ